MRVFHELRRAQQVQQVMAAVGRQAQAQMLARHAVAPVDLEILVQGERVEELAKQLSTSLDFTPQVGPLPQEGVIPVEVDREVVKNSQQQVDAGSSPWQLDPTQVAFTFVALKISPEGITGEPPLDYNALQLTDNDGKKAVVQVSEGPVKTVYLERLIRQDETGIWTVTGYVPR